MATTLARPRRTRSRGIRPEWNKGLQWWLDGHAYDSVAQVKGTLSQFAVGDPATYERAQYIHALAEGVSGN